MPLMTLMCSVCLAVTWDHFENRKKGQASQNRIKPTMSIIHPLSPFTPYPRVFLRTQE